jgi:CBS domain-containing protein
MQVQEIMTRGVEMIHPETTLQDAADKMKELDVGLLPVCAGDLLVGMLTDRDITIRSTSEGLDPWTTPVRDAMTREVIFCFEDQDVAEAARVMKDKQVRRLLVLNRDNRLAGIISLADLAVDAGDEQLAGDTLEGVSEPAQPRR